MTAALVPLAQILPRLVPVRNKYAMPSANRCHPPCLLPANEGPWPWEPPAVRDGTKDRREAQPRSWNRAGDPPPGPGSGGHRHGAGQWVACAS